MQACYTQKKFCQAQHPLTAGVMLAGARVANLSTDEAGNLIISGPKRPSPKEDDYRKRASHKSAQNSRTFFRPQWRPSASSPKSLTPQHKLQWLAPPPGDVKPWARRKPPSSYLVQVCTLARHVCRSGDDVSAAAV